VSTRIDPAVWDRVNSALPAGRHRSPGRIQRIDGPLDASGRLLRQLGLGPSHLAPELAGGAHEPAVASVETGSEKRQGDHLRHDTPPKAPLRKA
jgi:hypothetical protein